METRYSRFAAAAAAGVVAATTAVACGAAGRAATTGPTVSGSGSQADSSAVQHTSSVLRVDAEPASCAHVSAGDLSSVVTFHKPAGSGPATYTVQAIAPSNHRPAQMRAVRVGAGAPSTLNLVWHQQTQARGDVTLRVVDENGRQVAVVKETPGGERLAARCGSVH